MVEEMEWKKRKDDINFFIQLHYGFKYGVLPLIYFYPRLLKKLGVDWVWLKRWNGRKERMILIFLCVLGMLCLYRSLLDEEGSWLGRMESVPR